MATNVQLKEAVAKLRAQMGLSEREVKDRFQQATDIGYWQNLSPSMGIMDEESLARLDHTTLSSEQEDSALLNLAKHGYFQMPALLAPATVARMHSSVEAVRAAGWPAVFSWVYDEFWAALRTPPMVQFFRRQLGAGYLQSASGLWVHCVDPRNRGSGWVPHVDSTKDQGRITVWIPLMDVTVRNGCMYVIPRVHKGNVVRHAYREGKPYLIIPEQDLPKGQQVCAEVRKRGALSVVILAPNFPYPRLGQ